jgi:type VII secretion protein EccB
MPSRQDQLHSYQYSLQRVVAALVTHDPDPHRSPMRRAGTTALVSLLIAAVAVGAVAVYGVLTGDSSGKPADTAAVYVEKGTGARFVLSDDSKLHPVLNFSSALLLATGQAPDVVSTSAKQLAKVALGPTLGIPDAPDSLPDSGTLLKGAWSVCTTYAGGDAKPVSTVLVGDSLQDNGIVQPDPGQVSPGLLVTDPTGATYLVYESRRFLIPADQLRDTARVLNMNGQQPWKVSTAWINNVPLGPELTPPTIPGFGEQSSLDNLRVGQLVSNADSAAAVGTSFQVVMADGLAPLTAIQALLMRTVPGVGAPVPTGADFGQLTNSKTTVSDADSANPLPLSVPSSAASPSSACVTRHGDGKNDRVLINSSVPVGTAAVSGAAVPGAVQTDRVSVTRGSGAVVISSTSPSAPASSGTITLITDTGVSYAVATREALAKLGYGDVTLPRVPSELVSLLPKGPALDPVRAAQTTG